MPQAGGKESPFSRPYFEDPDGFDGKRGVVTGTVTTVEAMNATEFTYKDLLARFPTDHILTMIATEVETRLKPHELPSFYQELAKYCAARAMYDLYMFYSNKSDVAANLYATSVTNNRLLELLNRLSK